MTADKLEIVAEPAPLLPGRRWFMHTFEDWDGNTYTIQLKGMDWMPLEVIDVWLGGDNKAPFRWGASDEDYEILQKLPRRDLDTIFELWGKDSEVTPGESRSSPASSATGRGGRRSKPTSSR